MQLALQNRFLAAWLRFSHGKIVEQCLHTFQNGYTYLVFPCKVFRILKFVRSASFNKDAMVSGDDLVCVI